MTGDEAKGVLGFIYAAFPREKASGQTVAVFIAGLADMDTDCVKQAAMEWVKEHRFPPSLAELRGRAKELQDSRRAIAQTQQATAALPAGSDNERKQRLQVENLTAWSNGLIDTATMLRDGAQIYAHEEPIPSDGAEVIAAAEEAIATLRKAEPGPLMRHLYGAVGQVATTSRAPHFPTPPPDAGSAGGRRTPPQRRKRNTQDAWWEGN